VIDHYGLPEDEGPESPAGRALLELISLPNVWIKLSAPPIGAAPILCNYLRLRDRLTALVQTGAGSLRVGQRLAAHAASNRRAP